MALKSRIRSRLKPPLTPGTNPPTEPTLKLVEANSSAAEEPNPTPVGPPSQDTPKLQELEKKFAVYHRINELYQEAGRDIHQFMRGLLDIVLQVLEAEGGSLWILNNEKSEAKCIAASGRGKKENIGSTATPGKGITGWVLEKNKPLLVSDVENDERFFDKNNPMQYINTKSVIACPLRYRGEIIGAAEIVNKRNPNARLTEQELSFLEDICTPAAMHIKTSMSIAKQSDLLKRMQTFGHLHEAFSSTMELEKLLEIVLAKATELLNAEVGSIWLTEDVTEKIECKIASGPTKDKVIGLKLNKGVGIIGWVIDNQKPSMVEDCSKDPRFSSAVDEKINFVTRSLISAPLSVKGEPIGAIQIINKKGEDALFQSEDLELLMLFASSSAMYIKNARLFASEKKANELSALIKVSKEITSTLDLDSVLMSVVNLSSAVINYDRAVISIEARGGTEKYDIRAISQIQRIDRESDDVKELKQLHNKIAEGGKEILINNREDYEKSPDSVPEVLTYLLNRNLQSLWIYVLQDDQGALGVFSMESANKNLIPDTKKELLSILVSQSTVALRNASLYTTIPKSEVFSNFGAGLLERLTKIRQWSLKKQFTWATTLTAGILALVFLRVPYQVAANIEVVPLSTTFYSQSTGRVQQILVKEGQTVQTGDLMVKLNVDDLLIELKQKESQRQKTLSEMIKLQSEDRIAEFKIKENEEFSLQYEIERLRRQIENAEVRATAPGVVVSEKLEELQGMPVNFGQELIKIARTDRVFVNFQVPQDEAPYVNTGQSVKFKVFGHANAVFSEGITLWTVAAEGRSLTESDPTKYFIATAEVQTSQGLTRILRPGMTGRGKIRASDQNLASLIFGKPLKLIAMRLFF